jgi:hypothetical protein
MDEASANSRLGNAVIREQYKAIARGNEVVIFMLCGKGVFMSIKYSWQYATVKLLVSGTASNLSQNQLSKMVIDASCTKPRKFEA